MMMTFLEEDRSFSAIAKAHDGALAQCLCSKSVFGLIITFLIVALRLVTQTTVNTCIVICVRLINGSCSDGRNSMPSHLASTPTDCDVCITRLAVHNANELQDLNNQLPTSWYCFRYGCNFMRPCAIAEMLLSPRGFGLSLDILWN